MKRNRKLQLHPHGQYCVRIMRSGVSKTFFLGRNKKQAEKNLEQVERDIASGRISFVEHETTAVLLPDGRKDMRIEELAYHHLEWVKANRSAGTAENREFFLKKFLSFVGEKMVSQITRMTLEDVFVAEKARKPDKPNAGNEVMSNVKCMFRWAEEMEVCDLAFRRFPVISRTPPMTKRISDGDLTKLLAAASGDFKDMIRFGLLTGLRPLELRELKHDQIKVNPNGMMYVLIEQHKTSKSAHEPRPRSVPLSPEAEDIVSRQFKARPNSEHVFVFHRGKPYTRYDLKCRLRRLCVKAGTSRIYSPYALRHTFASMESDSGQIETMALARLMGHSTTRTLNRYVSNTLESHLKAVNLVGDRLKQLAG